VISDNIFLFNKKDIENNLVQFVYAHFNGFEYIANKLNEIKELKPDLDYGTNDLCYADITVRDHYQSEEGNMNFDFLDTQIKQGFLFSYSKGFHFAKTIQRLLEYRYGITAKFIVPKDAKVIFDGTGLGIADKIIFTGVLIRVNRSSD
jgi:hypothetical protein